MINQFLQNNFQVETKEKTTAQYFQYWNSPEFSRNFKSQASLLEEISSDFLDNKISPLRVHLTQCLINITYIDDLIIEEDEEELINFWESSEFTGIFFQNLASSDDQIIKASKASLLILEKLFISSWKLNFSIKNEDDLLIKLIPEIGDYEDFIYIGNSLGIELTKEKISKDSTDFLSIPNNTKLCKSDLHEKLITVNQSNTIIRPGSSLGLKEFEALEFKVTKGLTALSELTPNLFSTFTNFTHTIIALNEPGMVSFSLQSLPGYSSINLYERDFVDCIDDLIHENGHHFLNYILNTKELIIEDPEKEYFSPWRMVLRPIRGIYHGTFTFYWALELFSQLHANPLSNNYFSDLEMNKIKMRYIEEYYKLLYCQGPLEIAYKKELINKDGWGLINNIIEQVKSHKDRVELAVKSCTENEKTSIETMLSSLKN